MIASQQQLEFRILTGLHAGAGLLLSHGSHEIGSDLKCAVVVSDWPVQRSLFTIEKQEAGHWQVRFHDAALAAPFGLHEPVRFGDIVIVVSDPDSESPRPSDLALLTQMLTPTVPVAVAPEPRRVAGTWLVGGILIAVATAGAFALQSPRSVAATNTRMATPLNSLEQVKATVAKLKYGGVYVAMEGERIAVAGIVRNRAEAKNLAAQLTSLQLAGIEQRYAVESDIAAAINDAIARPGITVKHLGAGRFEIRGDIPPSVMQKIDLKRLKNDLGSVVSSITFQEPVVAVPAVEDVPNSQNKEDYQFKQGGDGVKYFTPK